MMHYSILGYPNMMHYSILGCPNISPSLPPSLPPSPPPSPPLSLSPTLSPTVSPLTHPLSPKPSPDILQSLLDLHSKEKIHSKLASIVKLARDCGILLDRGFYQKALIELRHWGQDPDAVTAVYKGLRKVDTCEQPMERERGGEGGERGREGWEGEERQRRSVCTSTTTDQQVTTYWVAMTTGYTHAVFV